MKRILTLVILALALSNPLYAIGPQHSGSWYWSAQSGHGFSIEVGKLPDGSPYVVVYWYTYDIWGNPIFLLGTGVPDGDILDVVFDSPVGMKFGEFDPDSVNRQDGGTGRLVFTDENNATFQYTPSDFSTANWGHSSISFMPLTKLFGIEVNTAASQCAAITSLPKTIAVEGVYCFTGHLSTSITTGNAITINTDNVTINMNGWKLDGLSAGGGTLANGIYAYQHKNITISNGTIRGFSNGIYLEDTPPYTASQGHLVEGIRADKNLFTGIRVKGSGNIVRRNHVVGTGGATAVDSAAVGIALYGPGGRALDNDITDTTAKGTGVGYGLNLEAADGAVVFDNRIDDVSAVSGDANGSYIVSSDNIVVQDNIINGVSSSAGNTYGVSIVSSHDVLVRGNSITSAAFGIHYVSSVGKYMDNLTSNVTTPFTSGTTVGIND